MGYIHWNHQIIAPEVPEEQPPINRIPPPRPRHEHSYNNILHLAAGICACVAASSIVGCVWVHPVCGCLTPCGCVACLVATGHLAAKMEAPQAPTIHLIR